MRERVEGAKRGEWPGSARRAGAPLARRAPPRAVWCAELPGPGKKISNQPLLSFSVSSAG